MLIHDTAAAFIDLINTALLWVQLLAAALTFTVIVVGVAALPLVAPAARARRTPPVRRRPIPSWAHTQPYDEAA